MPAPIVLSTLTPETKKVVNPPTGQPVIATKADLRDGTRPLPFSWLRHSQASRAPDPLLRFTDLISGPATGLGDGLGSGVIVTIWAQGIGDSQGSGQVYFTDFAGTKRPAEHVYYWKRADGELPSGPARLWYSHLMQEIAFSIPSGSVNGLGQITVETGGQTSNAMPFTVRAGNIYHVKSTGSDANDGSFASPWLTWQDGARVSAPAGSTIYFHDIVTGNFENPPVRGIYWNTESASGNQSNQFGIAAYPGFQPRVIAQRGFENFKTTGQVVSKYTVFSSNYLETDANGRSVVASIIESNPGDTYGILTTSNGRVIANRIQDIPGGMSNKWNGAINSRAEGANAQKILGNEVHDHGDNGSGRLHHTTYLSNRSGASINAWEWGFNFIYENRSRWGIHQYDESVANSDVLGTVGIHDNVIVDQGGGAISIGCADPVAWTADFDVYNNVMINAGLPSDWDGIDPATAVGNPANCAVTIRDQGNGTTTGLLGAITMEHNLAYKYDASATTGQSGALGLNQTSQGPTYRWNKNIAYSDQNVPFVNTAEVLSDLTLVDLAGNNNVYFSTLSSAPSSIIPAWDSAPITADPLITFDGAIATIASGSPASGKATRAGHDIYGVPRTTIGTLGPVEVSA